MTPTKVTHSFVPFSKALEQRTWGKMNKKAMKRLASSLWSPLSASLRTLSRSIQLTHLRNSPLRNPNRLPLHLSHRRKPRCHRRHSPPPTLLRSFARHSRGHLVRPLSLPTSLADASYSRIAATAPYEFPPSAAIVGGIAGQDVLNVLGGKEAPVRNLMVFQGETGAGNVWALGL